MKCTVKMGSGDMTCVPIFMQIGTSVEEIFRFSFNNLKGSNVGVTDGRDLQNALFKWAKMG
jgi:hypothetical protein